MKFKKHLPSISSFMVLIAFSGCIHLELFPEKTVVFEGRIVEAFDTTKPIDSVLVEGCTQKISLFPNWPSCDTETLTDPDGSFFISLKADDLTGRKISYAKEGYQSLDSCITLGNGKMECYIKSLPTVFYIYSPYKENTPFIYDSLHVQVSTATKDTTVHYTTNSFTNSQGGTSYYWTSTTEPSNSWNRSYTYIHVADNSRVKIEAHYYKNNELVKTDDNTLFCKKGIGTHYEILDK